jgi:hypothetical protein
MRSMAASVAELSSSTTIDHEHRGDEERARSRIGTG